LYVPRHLPLPAPIAFVACGQSHVLAVTRVTGGCFTWGCGFHGALGHGDESHRTTPTKVEALAGHRVLKAAAGEAHSLLIAKPLVGCGEDTTRQVFTFGRGSEGEMGNGDTYASRRPIMVEALDGLEPYNIACGNYFSVAAVRVGEGYSVYAWGDNRRGAVGFRLEEGEGSAAGADSISVSRPRSVVGTETDDPLLALSCSNDSCLMLAADHRLYIWGESLETASKADDHRDGAVELPTPAESSLVDVVCGEMHVVCADVQGKVWSFGHADFGKLGREGPGQSAWSDLSASAAEQGKGAGLRVPPPTRAAIGRVLVPQAPDGRSAVLLAVGSNHTMVCV